jgi:arylsulfatase A-like enzyme
MDRPNVLFVTLDQWRADALSCAGHPVVETPHLDQLAAEGVRFANHFAQCAPCGPSRASILTSQYLMNHRAGCNGTPLDARFTNLALEARGLGHEPTLFGYTDTSVDPRTVTDPDDARLRTYEGVLDGFSEGLTIPEPFEPWLDHLRAAGFPIGDEPEAAFAPDPRVDDTGRGSTWAPTVYGAAHSISAFVADAVLDHLRGRNGWFVHASFLRPHPPFRATPEHHDRYDPADVPPPVRLAHRSDEAARHPFLASALGLRFVCSPDDELEQRQWQATYYALVHEVDEQLGRIFAALRAAGQWDRTLVVVSADHGEELGDHWLSGKLGWFDGSYATPLLIRDPRPEADRSRGRVVDAFTESVDIMPTILDWLGAEELPLQCDGRSLLGWLEGRTPDPWRDEVRYEFDFRVPQVLPHPLGMRMDQAVLCVIRTATRKYVHFPTLPPVLIDLEADPGELSDVIEDPSYQNDRIDCLERLANWRIEHAERTMGGTMLTPQGVYRARDWPR